jgi:acid phosphatase family membrane protein YuiD
MTTTYFEHTGPYPNEHSNLSPALRFLANYTSRIDSADYDCSYLSYYYPNAVFYDATGVDYVGGAKI